MKYVYYNPLDNQVMAEIDTPRLVSWPDWEARGYLRAIVANGVTVSRNHRITVREGIVTGSEVHLNPVRPTIQPEEITRQGGVIGGRGKLLALGITHAEMDALGLPNVAPPVGGGDHTPENRSLVARMLGQPRRLMNLILGAVR